MPEEKTGKTNEEQVEDEKKSEVDEEENSKEETGKQDDKKSSKSDESKEDESSKEEEKEKEGEENSDSNSDDDENNSDSEDDNNADLPDWARKKLGKVKNEAKNLRTRLREAEEKLENVEDLDEVKTIVEKIKTERQETERELLVENVARQYELPKESWKRLSGKTREELEKDAEELAALFGSEFDEDREREGGMSPRSKDRSPSDPRSLAKQYGRRAR